MNTLPDLETVLRHAPRPTPPTDLLRILEQQIRISPTPQAEAMPALWRRWKRLWLPVAGVAGTAALALIIAAVWGFSAVRTLAGSLQELGRMRSCRIVESYRVGASLPVIVDNSKPVNVYPNFSTSWTPENPLVISDHWFQVDPREPSRTLLRTASPRQDVWQQGNRVLTIDHKTGARSLRLVSAPNTILSTLKPLAGLASQPLREVKLLTGKNSTLKAAPGLWVGELRQADPSIPGAEDILRVWLNASNQLPARIQLLSTGFPQVAPEVLMREYQFSQYDAAFPDATFRFDVSDQDLAPLSLTRSSLDALGDNAVSFEVTGDAGAEVVGTLQDQAGTQKVRGTVPFTFVHDQRGDLQFDFHMVDGKRHNFGLRFNNTDMRTVTSGLKGKSSADSVTETVAAVD